MKKYILCALVAALSLGLRAQEAKQPSNEPVFTNDVVIPLTSVKNQNRSGTCWAYSTVGFVEAEIIKATGRSWDLCEMFICHHDYLKRAEVTVRMHGDCDFSQGGSAEDVIATIKEHGICPEDKMPLPGTPQGDSLANFNEFFTVMTPYVKAVANSNLRKLTPQWKVGLNGILDAYLGEVPTEFVVDGKTYTPQSFAASLGVDWNDYVSITSYTHHPFYTAFPVEVQDNWRQGLSYNVPLAELEAIVENALANGYTIAWGGDVSEEGFTRQGTAYAIDDKGLRDLSGSDQARWLKMRPEAKRSILDSLGTKVPEIVPTEELRQKRFDNWELTDDHGMLIYGKAHDQFGKEFYIVRNSWGETGKYQGAWYMSKNFIYLNAMDIMVNKNAIPKSIRKKLGI